MKKEEIIQKLIETMRDEKIKKQMLPDQYVVAYYRMKDDSLIGYHLSTFCQVTPDILAAKRYQGRDNAKQLSIIFNNLTSTLGPKKDHIFSSIVEDVKKTHFPDMSIEDIYIDSIYLCDGTEPQENFNIQIL